MFDISQYLGSQFHNKRYKLTDWMCKQNPTFCFIQEILLSRAVVAHAFNPSTWEAEAGGVLTLRPAWSTSEFQDSQGLHRETLSQKTKQKRIKTCSHQALQSRLKNLLRC